MYEVNAASHNWLIRKIANSFLVPRLAGARGTVLDLGCGIKPFEQELTARSERYLGVDWPSTPHASKPHVIADLNRPLPFDDCVADHVVVLEVLEHLSEPGAFLAEALRVLKPGGQLTLSVPFQWRIHEAPWDFQRFTRHGLEYQLRKCGFADTLVRETTGFWTTWILKLNYQLLRLVQGPRWLRIPVRLCLIPAWWIGQSVAPLLDRAFPDSRETSGYFVTATRP